MTDSAEAPAYRHALVYHTMRGSVLSGGRGLMGPALLALPARLAPSTAPVPVPIPVPVAATDPEPAHDDGAALYELRRYSEPND